MSEDRIDYGEIICEAVDNIVSKKLEGLEFDITKTCRIVDDTYKRQGKYTVTDNSIKFEAYSAITTLNIDDNVLVNIPYGDYNNQKTILNKIVFEDDSDVLNYTSPLEAMLKFTKNILNEQTAITNDFSILANENGENGEASLVHLYSFNWEDYSGYDLMGISAKFLTWLGRYNTVSGVYGLKFIFSSKDEGVSSSELDFNINDMTGNPYEFETYYKQEKLINISHLKNIEQLDIYLYQLNNFLNEEDEFVPWEIAGDPNMGTQGEKLNNNIRVDKDTFEIYLGYNLGDFNGDSLKISSTPGYNNYSKIDAMSGQGDKTLTLRWVHKEADNSYSVLTKDDVVTRNLEVFWFRYKINSGLSSQLMEIAEGANWTQEGMYQDALDPFECIFTPDVDKAEERIKAVCRITENGIPDKKSTEIVTFYNEDSVLDTTDYNAASGLWINCTDNSEGNYFIYDQSGDIINEGQGQGFERKFEARYGSQTLSSKFEKIESIIWTLPKKVNTMLTYKDKYFTFENGESKEDSENGYIKITRLLEDAPGNILYTYQSYNIKNNWHQANSNNTVKCEIYADGNIYQASLDLNFGKSGTSGTNLTLVLNFENGKNAYVLEEDKEDENEECYVSATLYDMSGSKINFAENDILEWSWYHGALEGEGGLVINPDPEDKSRIKLTKHENFGNIIIPATNYHILQLNYTPKDKNISSTQLTAYLTIPIKRNNSYGAAEGARKVIYDSQGVPNYYTDAYILYNNNQEVLNDVDWELQGNINDFSLRELIKNGISYKALVASPVYIKNDNDQLCINARLKQDNSIVWSQPILIMQSQYDYAIVNDWSGTVSITDATIMTTMLGAGKKDESNLFSGILIGDIKPNASAAAEKEDVVSKTGLYALSKGITTFSLTEDGMMKLQGDLDKGSIIFGSDDKNQPNVIQDCNGNFTLNIDDGVLTITDNTNAKLTLSGKNTDSYIKFINDSSQTIFDLPRSGNYILQSGDGGLSLDLTNKKISLDSNSSIVGSSSITCNTLTCSNFTCSSNLTANEITYKNQTLSNYIQSLIDQALAGLE